MWVATLYIICIPMFLGAMTGYDSTSIAWVSLDDNNNIVAAESIQRSGLIMGTNEKLFDEPICVSEELYSNSYSAMGVRRTYCDCQVRNGTMLSPKEFERWYAGGWPRDYRTHCKNNCQYIHTTKLTFKGRFDYPNNNQTFIANKYDQSITKVQQCQ